MSGHGKNHLAKHTRTKPWEGEGEQNVLSCFIFYFECYACIVFIKMLKCCTQTWLAPLNLLSSSSVRVWNEHTRKLNSAARDSLLMSPCQCLCRPESVAHGQGRSVPTGPELKQLLCLPSHHVPYFPSVSLSSPLTLSVWLSPSCTYTANVPHIS